ncbi:MAG: peptide deformylase [Planctomycetes bacterium]|nr:peptide deformylase [Planctomycetota bacterium]
MGVYMLKICIYPDPILKQKAKKIETIDEELKNLANEMIETMHVAEGVGLAGPQVGVSKQIIVVNPTGEKGEEQVYINPKILSKKERFTDCEGCLSFPGIYGEVSRYKKIKVTAQLLTGEEKTWDATDFEARVLQHEIDHLKGVLFVEKVDPVDQIVVEKELKILVEKYSKQDNNK